MSFKGPRQLREHEQMDAPGADPVALRRSLGFIRRINRLLGYNAATVRALGELVEGDVAGARGGADLDDEAPRERCSRARVTVLDVATGSGDLPEALGRWGRRRGVDVRCVGLDLHPVTLAVARAWAPGVALVRGDALRLPFADGAFDYATCAMFLHHLETADAVRVIRELERVTRRGWILADLLRRRRALAWISLFTRFSGAMVRHDARASVRQAWLPQEARDLARSADVPARYREAFGHRFLLVRARD